MSYTGKVESKLFQSILPTNPEEESSNKIEMDQSTSSQSCLDWHCIGFSSGFVLQNIAYAAVEVKSGHPITLNDTVQTSLPCFTRGKCQS
jgi:hypothetical protein